MGGRGSCRDLRPHPRYRALFVDDELTPDVMPRRDIAGRFSRLRRPRKGEQLRTKPVPTPSVLPIFNRPMPPLWRRQWLDGV